MLINTPNTETFSSQTLDYDTLRQQGIAWLEKLAGSEWTDFNAHDPGITILEQVCYALTDLSYRINFNMADLLSSGGADAYANLYRAEQILPTKPVTLSDLRKIVIDVEGVKNAWLEPVNQPPTQSLKSATNNIAFKGLYQVLIEQWPELGIDSNTVLSNVAQRLHDNRGLATDFDPIQVIPTQPVAVQASIEIDPVVDAEVVYVAILEKIAAYFSPSIRFYTLEECLAQGKAIEEIFEGPLLEHGFIDNQELALSRRKDTLYSSVLIREIMAVSGVRVVEYVAFKENKALIDGDFKPYPNSTPKLDTDNSTLILKKRQLPVQLDTIGLNKRFLLDQRSAEPPVQNSGLPLPTGRDRHIDNYYSIMQQFPHLYGIGETGLPSTASEQRKAQAKQLKAYLLFFDQLLANGFVQLAHAKDLLSFNNDHSPTYFAASLDDPVMAELWVEQNPDVRKDRLQKIFGTSAPGDKKNQAIADWQRKNRFADHLLARFAEQFSDFNSFDASTSSTSNPTSNGLSTDKTSWLASKLTLLRNYDQISASMGTGRNLMSAADASNCCGLEQILNLKLGIQAPEKFYVVEHVLFRPMISENIQLQTDPYSFQLTVVFFVSANRSADYKTFAERTVRDEAPAHLQVSVLWESVTNIGDFSAKYQDWQQKFSDYRQKYNDFSLNGNGDTKTLIAARDVIAMYLNIGQSRPD